MGALVATCILQEHFRMLAYLSNIWERILQLSHNVRSLNQLKALLLVMAVCYAADLQGWCCAHA